jgi:hypothetical protein
MMVRRRFLLACLCVVLAPWGCGSGVTSDTEGSQNRAEISSDATSDAEAQHDAVMTASDASDNLADTPMGDAEATETPDVDTESPAQDITQSASDVSTNADVALEQDAGSSVVMTTNTGTVMELGECDLEALGISAENMPSNSSCERLQIACEALDDIELTLFHSPPEQGSTPKGVVTLGSGGGGTGYYSKSVAQNLNKKGFHTLIRAWSFAWETGPGGMRKSSCRFMTLLQWLRSQPWTESLPLCATGNSGGSTEIGYVMSYWNAGELLDLAVPTSGPPMGRVDLGCLGDEAWETECLGMLTDEQCPDGQVQCTYGLWGRELIDLAYEGTPCVDEDTDAAAMLMADSVVSADGLYDYPQTYMHFIYGLDDCSEAVPLGLFYPAAITSEVSVNYAQAPHGVFSTIDGGLAIVNAIESECIVRH